jgi:kynurenine 3-monooxygenase
VSLEQRILDIAIPMRQRIIHPLQGDLARQNYGRTGQEAINSVSRKDLNCALIDAAERLEGVDIHFGQRCIGVDLATNTVKLRAELDKSTRDFPSDVIIGTDGSASAVRESLGQQGGLTESRDRLSHSYKELHIPAGAGGAFQIEKGGLHIWPRGSFMMIALPNVDGSFTCTMFLEDSGPRSFDHLSDREKVEQFFAQHFPDAIGLIPNLVEQFLGNRKGHLDTITCAPWYNEGRICLLGDAAHAIIPFYGQGLNCALQDVTRYFSLLDRCGGDFALTHRLFFEERKPEADAIAQLARRNFIEMSERVADPVFRMRKALEHRLEHEFPDRFTSTYAKVTFNTGSYVAALRAEEILDPILYAACVGKNSVSEIDAAAVLGEIEQAVALSHKISPAESPSILDITERAEPRGLRP